MVAYWVSHSQVEVRLSSIKEARFQHRKGLMYSIDVLLEFRGDEAAKQCFLDILQDPCVSEDPVWAKVSCVGDLSDTYILIK